MEHANALIETTSAENLKPGLMKALVFHGPHNIRLEEHCIPKPGPGEAVIRVTLTTICGSDVHIVKG